MKREITFKGIRLDNGKEQLGQLLETPIGVFIITGSSMSLKHKEHITVTAYEVDYKTVFQYCGKSGKDYCDDEQWEKVCFDGVIAE